MLLANLTAFVVSCSLTILLASGDGAMGAAVATLCGESALALGLLLALLHGHPELRPRLRVVPKVVLAAVPATAIALLSGVPSLVRAALALAVYGLLILFMRALPAEILELLPTRLRRSSS